MKKSRSKALHERKAARAYGADTISRSAYNGIIGLTILYGFVVNALMVMYARPFFESLPIIGVLIGYIVSCILGTIIAFKVSGSNCKDASFTCNFSNASLKSGYFELSAG